MFTNFGTKDVNSYADGGHTSNFNQGKRTAHLPSVRIAAFTIQLGLRRPF